MRQRTFLSLISIFLFMGSAYAENNINTVINQEPVGNRIVNYSLDSKYKLPYMAVTSEEVSDLVGFWQSDDDGKDVAQNILKRAVSICAQDNGELVDFEIKATDDNGSFVVLDDGSKKVIQDNYKWSKSMIAANLASVGVTGLIAVAGNRSWKTIGMAISVDLGLNYGVDLILGKLQNLDLKGFLSYKHVHFKKIICVNSENLTKKQIGDQKLKYHCPKFDTTKPYCDKFKSFGQFQCFRYGKNNFNSTDEQTMKVCEKNINSAQATCVNSALESRWKPGLKYATEHCSRIETPYQEMAVTKALERLDLKDSVNQVLKLKTDEQAQVATKAMDKLVPALAVKVALEIENKAQAKFAIAMIDKGYPPKYAAELALKIKTDIQANLAIAVIDKWYRPKYAVEVALKMKLENKAQEKLAIAMIEKGYHPKYAVKLALKIKTDFQANLAIALLDKGRRPKYAAEVALKMKLENKAQEKLVIAMIDKGYRPKYALEVALKIKTDFQANLAIAMIDKGYPPKYALEVALKIKTDFQANLAIAIIGKGYRPKYALEVALKISTSEQAARALQGMNKNKWNPGHAVQKALE